MAEPEFLYNFGVLTKRYELVSRTASQLAPGIAGLSVGFLMILAGLPLPLPFVPVLVGFWFALGRIPFGRHRGVRVRSVVGPLTRYWVLQLAGKTHWVMPAMWLSVAVDPDATRTLDHMQSTEATSVVEPGGARGNLRGRGTKTRRGRTRREASEQLPPELGRLRWMAMNFDGAEAGLLLERARQALDHLLHERPAGDRIGAFDIAALLAGRLIDDRLRHEGLARAWHSIGMRN